MAKNIIVELKDLSLEEIKTKSDIEKSGETVYYLPVEIQNLDQLYTLGINRNQCRTWRCGSELKIIHLTPCREAVFRQLARDSWLQRTRDYRNSRCIVPGKQKGLIRCPEKNKCDVCPFGISFWNRQPFLVSLDELIDVDREPFSEDSVDQFVCQRMELQEIKSMMDEKDKRLFKIFVLMNLLGYKKYAIAKILHTSPKHVKQLIEEMNEIIWLFRESYQYQSDEKMKSSVSHITG